MLLDHSLVKVTRTGICPVVPISVLKYFNFLKCDLYIGKHDTISIACIYWKQRRTVL